MITHNILFCWPCGYHNPFGTDLARFQSRATRAGSRAKISIT